LNKGKPGFDLRMEYKSVGFARGKHFARITKLPLFTQMENETGERSAI